MICELLFFTLYLAADIVIGQLESGSSYDGIRVKRQTISGGGSILTVEWEGIHSGVPDDSAISGFVIEYRPETSSIWVQHDGVVPYQGPHYQYRVRIKDLPSGIVYYVRIKVLSRHNEVLVQTPEIKAQSEKVKIVCNDDITVSRNVRVLSSGKHSLTFIWDPPECGAISKYEYVLKGVDEWALFDVHRNFVEDTEMTIHNLLPGTTYSIKIRPKDVNDRVGPWSEHTVHAATEGRAPAVSGEINTVYKSDKEIRVQWIPYVDHRIQHYEVCSIFVELEALHVFRDQVPANETTYLFNDLKPSTDYNVGVIAFVQHEPRVVYRLRVRTSKNEAELWSMVPSVTSKVTGKFTVQWSKPLEFKSRDLKGFLVEYRLRNETTWKPYGEVIPYHPERKEYNTEIVGLSERIIYAIRVYLVDKEGEVVAVTDEFNVGSEGAKSCTGVSGVPLEVKAYVITQNSMTFTWNRPVCDESFGPIEGYEYKVRSRSLTRLSLDDSYFFGALIGKMQLFWSTASRDGEPKRPSFITKDKVTIDRLQPGESYTFKIRSRTRSGHSPWSQTQIAHTKPAADRGKHSSMPNLQRTLNCLLELGNIYNLRIILAPPRSYLAWRPLPEDRGKVRSFKLSYKLSSSDKWTTVENFPEEFECPVGIGDESDSCFDLVPLQFGVQYTADVSDIANFDIAYQLNNGEWSKKGNPLFFILVEAGIPKVPEAPAQLTIRFLTENTAELSWLPPLSDVKIDEYEVTPVILGVFPFAFPIHPLLDDHCLLQISVVAVRSSYPGIYPGSAFSLRTPGNVYTQTVDRFFPNTVYNVSVIAFSRSIGGPAVWEVVGKTSPVFEVKVPKVRQQGEVFQVNWEVSGQDANLCCYQVDARDEQEQSWRTVSGPVSHESGRRMYSQEVTGLRSNTRYHIRVRAISFDNYATVATSPSVGVVTQCQAPTAPPSDLQVRLLEPTTILLSWSHPARDSWSCADIFYNVEALVDGQTQRYQVRADPRGFRVEHRVPTQPGHQWRFRVQTANMYGSSPWSEYQTVRTEHEVLASVPQVRPHGNRYTVNWQAQGTSSGRVYGYMIECKASPSSPWRSEGTVIPLRPGTTSYSTEVPSGRCSFIRVSVLDQHQRVFFSGPEMRVESHCLAPVEAPSGIVVTTPDPRHVRLTWKVPSRESWRCSDVEYELQVLEPSGISPVRLNNGIGTHVFESRPNQNWAFQMRTVSGGGASPWSAVSRVRTPAAMELITTPTVVYQHNLPVVTWQSVEGVQELVAGYRVEMRRHGQTNWEPAGPQQNAFAFQMKYVGWQRPYSFPLSQLRPGERVEVRVQVIDHNNDVQYTSPCEWVQKERECRPPASPPRGVNVIPIDATRIRLSWNPLSRNEWNCASGWYNVKFSNVAEQGYRNYTADTTVADFQSAPFTSWEFRIQAANEAGQSAWSNPVTGKTQTASKKGNLFDLSSFVIVWSALVSSPVLNVRSISMGPKSVQLSWVPPHQPNGVITEYLVTYKLLSNILRRGQCVDSPEREIVMSTKEPRVILEGLHPSSRYQVTIAAKTNVPGEPTNYEFITDEDVPVAPPQAFQAVGVKTDRVKLSWQAPPCLLTNGEVTSFEYELIGVDNWAAGQYFRQRTNTNNVEVTGLTGNTKYKGRVRAYTSKGAGPWSEYVVISTLPADSPNIIPMVRVVDIQATDVTLLWLAPYPPLGTINRYRVQYALSGTGAWKMETSPIHRLSCSQEVLQRWRSQARTGGQPYCTTISGLLPERSYDFQVPQSGMLCSNLCCTFIAMLEGSTGTWGPWSNIQSAKTGGGMFQVHAYPATEDGPVKILNLEKTDVTQDSISIKWDTESHQQGRLKGFRIVAVPISRQGRLREHTVDNVINRYRIDGLDSNIVYNVTVQARTDSEIPAVVVPPVLSAQGAEVIIVRWIAPIESNSIVGYAVEYKSGTREWQRLGDVVNHLKGKSTYEATIDKLSPNTDVTVRVTTVGRGDLRGAPSREVTERTFCAAPGIPPQNIRLESLSVSQLKLSWTPPPQSTWQCDSINYEIAFSTGADKVEKIIPVNGQYNEYILPSAPHTQWSVKLRTSNKVGKSPWSESHDITTKQGAPGRVRDLTLTPLSPNEVRVSWSVPLERHGIIVGYDVSYRLKYRLACPDEEPRDVSRSWITVYNVKGLDYTLTGLLPYSEYEVKVNARTTELGPEETKVVQTLPQPPSAPPLDLKVTFQMERTVGLVWMPVECSQRHGYIMTYEYELVGLDDWAKLDVRIANTTELKTEVDGLTPFTKYVFRVKAYNNVGGGPATADLEVMTSKAAAPLPPQDLTVMSEGLDFVSISWLPPYPPYGPIESYKVQYKVIDFKRPAAQWEVIEFPKTDRNLQCGGGTTFELSRVCYNISGLEVSTQYRIQVAAKIVDGNYGVWSSHVTANTLVALPDAPRAITLIGKTDSSLSISWLPPEDVHGRITGYKVTVDVMSQKTTTGTVTKTFPVPHPRTELTIENLEPDTPYNITVQASTSRGYGPGTSTIYSTDSTVVPPLVVPPTAVGQTSNCIKISWTPSVYSPQKLLGYIVEYRKYNEYIWHEFDGVVKHDSTKTTFTEEICGLDPDSAYLFRVKVIDTNSKLSEPSPHLESRSGCQAPSLPPSNLRITAVSSQEVRITWQPPPPDSWHCSKVNYRLKYNNSTQGNPEIELMSTVTDYLLHSSPYTKWSVQIRTENEAGSSHWSEEVSVVTPEGVPGKVSGVFGEPSGFDRIKVSWTPPDDPNGVITGYVVSYRLKSKGGACPTQFSRLEERPVTGEKVIIKDLLPASTYEIAVRAKTTVEGEPSDFIYVSTEEIAPTGSPRNVKLVHSSKSSAAFAWEEPPCEQQNGEITGYDYIIKSEDPWVKDDLSDSTTADRIQVFDLVPFTQYSLVVRATNSKGKGPFSEPVKFTTKPDVPSPPTDLRTDKEFPSAVAISFLPPSPPHGMLNEYRIRYTPIDRISWHEVRKSPEALPCARGDSAEKRLCYRIVGLEPEMEHIVQVSAHNEGAGWGDWTKSLYVRTKEAEIPVIETPLRVSQQGTDSLTLMWEGLSPEASRLVRGYVLEYNVGGTSAWVQHNDIIPPKRVEDGQIYTETVDKLAPDTTYFFRLHVVDRQGRKGLSGPELQTHTTCGSKQLTCFYLCCPCLPSYRTVDAASKSERRSRARQHASVEPVPKQTWLCGNITYVVKFHNASHSGYVDLPSTETSYSMPAEPGARWNFQIRTQAFDRSGSRSQASDWSPEKSFVMPGIPGLIFVDLKKRGPDAVLLNWHVAPDVEQWTHGVDVTHVLRQMGNCPPINEDEVIPITEYNVQDRHLLLQNLKPYSLYEFTVSPRYPLQSGSKGIKLPKAIKTIRTAEKAPDGMPNDVKASDVTETSAAFTWSSPSCDLQHGDITQYEYQFRGIDEWAANDLRQATTARSRVHIHDLLPGTKYKFQVRAYTSVGHGPWSIPVEIETLGSGMQIFSDRFKEMPSMIVELGMPREVHPISVTDNGLTLTWLPPYPTREPVNNYRLRFRARDGAAVQDLLLKRSDLSCRSIKNPLITEDSLCYKLNDLSPLTSYQLEVAAVSPDGVLGLWSPSVYVTTRDREIDSLAGDLSLLYADAESLKVQWEPPDQRKREITSYKVSLYPYGGMDTTKTIFDDVPGTESSYHFRNLDPNTMYNVTVKGLARGRTVWLISRVFQTISKSLLYVLRYQSYAEGFLDWLAAPSDMQLIEKTDTMLHVSWKPPEILVPALADQVTHYKVTLSPFDPTSSADGQQSIYTVPKPGNRIKFDGLKPETIYNITVQAATKTGFGETLWGVYSTLPPPGTNHILRLKNRTPTSLHVRWTPFWGTGIGGYVLKAEPLWSDHHRTPLPAYSKLEARKVDHVIRGLSPSTVYNVSLVPLNRTGGAWAVYATLPPGAFVVSSLKICDQTPFAFSLSFDPIDDPTASHYQVRYLVDGVQEWHEHPQKSYHELRCPGDPCSNACYLIYNLDGKPHKYTIQVRAFVEGVWNQWKTAVIPAPLFSVPSHQPCCIVPPPFFVDHIGDVDTTMSVLIKPVPNDTYVQRYFVVVDEREQGGFINESLLTDKLTARRRGLPYYATASFDRHTLTAEKEFVIGNGEVHGGYLNYPLVKGKKYNWAFLTIWMVDGKPVIGMYRDKSAVATRYIGGWPWWWLLLLFLLLLLLLLLCCCLLWLFNKLCRRKKRLIATLDARQPLLGEEKEKTEMARNLKALESRIDNIRSQLESKVRLSQAVKGEFEDGYVRGFKDASKLTSASMARRRLEEDYGGMKMDFQSGYAQGLRDAGMQGMSQSMQHLASRGGQGNYSSGYMQGFRDGDSGIFGNRITTTLLRRLEEQYPNEDDFRQGYVEGFKDALQNKSTVERRDKLNNDRSRSQDTEKVVSESLNKLTEKLSTLERQTRGDEIHTTKIYHVYNQLPESVGYATSGQYLAQELEELSRSESHKGTLRRHYTPGDYLKYASDIGGGTVFTTGTQRPYRRTLSASNLRRGKVVLLFLVRTLMVLSIRIFRKPGFCTAICFPFCHNVTPLSSRRTLSSERDRIHRTEINQYNDTFSRRYQYRSKSDLSSYNYTLPKRYPSQTILDGIRPGPVMPGARREAVETLQRELRAGGIDRAPVGSISKGKYRTETSQSYGSDSAFTESTRAKPIYTPLTSRRADDSYGKN
ncbi:protein sidekick [Trichuris trichiura]|uniref:Protein sidekick n=1 Tax=Trichuris trichiura TaxID=36087 RepID=A0A077YWW2_TRITR|nr:protein sidekick [Trichuris trichiura]